jgi:hypothetical protein
VDGHTPEVSQRPEGPGPKTSETDPPAANQPVSDGDESPEAPPPATEDAAGRAANDPSLSQNVVPEVMQAPLGKPDGEVHTSR